MAGFVQKFKEMWSPSEDYEEFEEEDTEEFLDNNTQKINKNNNNNEENFSKHSSRIVNIHANTKLQVVLFKPEHFGEETRNIADELLKIHTIVLNLENTNKEASRRIIDFLGGVAYANGGKIKRVATDTFLITPYNVDLTGDDVLDELENNGICL